MPVYRKGESQLGLKKAAKAQRKDIKKDTIHTESYMRGWASTPIGIEEPGDKPGPTVATLNMHNKMYGTEYPTSGAGMVKGVVQANAQRARREARNAKKAN